MKPIYCVKCGNEIESGYAINPEVSAICETCYNEEGTKLTEEIADEVTKYLNG